MNLKDLGWNSHWESVFEPYRRESFEPGRILVAQRGQFRVWTAAGECDAEPSGKLRFDTRSRADWPVTGDWVALAGGGQRIEAVLPRRTSFSRKDAGAATEEQILAANVDVALLVTGLDGDFNLRRIERYLYLARASGARPVIVLNKSDLCPDLVAAVRAVEQIAAAVPVVPASALTGSGLHLLTAHIEPGETAVLLGSSGVGKSTIVNHLLGSDSQRTQPVREHDSRGRHTTTERELILLDYGWLLIDSPGIRELQLWAPPGEDAAVDDAFAEIAEIAARCRFSDCSHQGEPDCAVAEALEAGTLDPGRLENYRKMQAELAWLGRRQDERAASEHKRMIKRVHRRMRQFYRTSGK